MTARRCARSVAGLFHGERSVFLKFVRSEELEEIREEREREEADRRSVCLPGSRCNSVSFDV